MPSSNHNSCEKKQIKGVVTILYGEGGLHHGIRGWGASEVLLLQKRGGPGGAGKV